MMSANNQRLSKRARRKLVPAGLWSRGMIATLAAQFLSAFGDNALLFAALALVRKEGYPTWSVSGNPTAYLRCLRKFSSAHDWIACYF